MKRLSGKIKWYHLTKHFGFLLSNENNKEFFFHINDCQGFSPQEGQEVEFEIGTDKKNREKAVKIVSVRGAYENIID